MADYETLVLRLGNDGREVVVRKPGARRISFMVLEQRLPFKSVWCGNEEIVHVVHETFVTADTTFGSAANLNIHLHGLLLDGVYRCGADGVPQFVEVGSPTDDEVQPRGRAREAGPDFAA